MSKKNIFVEDFPFINFLEISASQAANQHMKAKVVGIVDEKFVSEYEQMKLHGKSVSIWVYEQNEEKRLWLNGIIEDVRINICGGLNTLSIELTSYSKKSDIHNHTRTFQDSTLTYNNIVKILQDYSGQDELEVLICNAAQKEPVDTFLIQHEETDWEFLRRLASRIHCNLFPCANLGRNGIYVGINPHLDKHILDTTEYIIRKDLDLYRRNQTDSIMEFNEYSAVSYIVNSCEVYHLCESIRLNGKDLYIYAIETNLVNAQLVHTYTLKSKKGFCTKIAFNHKLAGYALSGKVKAVQKDHVQIHLDGDIKQRSYRWFSYSTIYSSPDNTGWYFMPEVGDQVRLVLPSEQEVDSYVASSVHLGERNDSDIKSIRTRHHKEIVFGPEFISISNGAGSQIELHDEKGITIHSDKQILIESNENIDLKAQRDIKVIGNSSILLEQKENKIELNDTVDITAGRLRLR